MGITLLALGLVKASISPHFWFSSKVFVKRGKGVDKGDMEETDEVGSVGDATEAGETACERYFTVGEVVEYWEGAYVRGERLGFGEPAFVKKVVGNGVYAIKMVGSFRGKFRNVGWRSLFKDGSFNKKGARGDGARVRGETRLKQMAKEEAEAKLGVELRETKRQLHKSEKGKKEMEKQAEVRLKVQAKEARNAEKDLTQGHKRQLEEMRGDLERTKLEELKLQDELFRAGRQNTRGIRKELEQAQQHLRDKTETNEALDKALRKGVEKLDGLRDDGLWWKSKYSAEKAEVRRKEEALIEAAVEGRELRRVGETVTKRNVDLILELRAKLDAAEKQAQVFPHLASSSLLVFLGCFFYLRLTVFISCAQSRRMKTIERS